MRGSMTKRDSSVTSSSPISINSSSTIYQTLNPPNPPSFAKSSHDHFYQRKLSSMETSSDLPTDLSLGLSISSTNSSPRQEASADWPPVNTLLRRAMITARRERNNNPASPISSSSSSSSSCRQMRHISNKTSGDNSLFLKVKMEGLKIGRKIDVFALHGYPHLITTLAHMFSTSNILWAEGEKYSDHKRYHKWSHVLTYEDQDGDWMMVGDVPWEMFLTTVRRLKITRTTSS